MSGTGYAIIAYAVATALLWGYALRLWRLHRRLERRD